MSDSVSVQEAKQRRALYLESIDTIVKNGKAYNAAGMSLTRADLPDLRAMVAECDLIINGGNQRRFQRLVVSDD